MNYFMRLFTIETRRFAFETRRFAFETRRFAFETRRFITNCDTLPDEINKCLRLISSASCWYFLG